MIDLKIDNPQSKPWSLELSEDKQEIEQKPIQTTKKTDSVKFEHHMMNKW